jgi:hypothetical protein
MEILNYVGCESSRTFRNKERKYMTEKLTNLKKKKKKNIKNRNIRDLYIGINKVKKVYHVSSMLLKDENHDLLADAHIF